MLVVDVISIFDRPFDLRSESAPAADDSALVFALAPKEHHAFFRRPGVPGLKRKSKREHDHT